MFKCCSILLIDTAGVDKVLNILAHDSRSIIFKQVLWSNDRLSANGFRSQMSTMYRATFPRTVYPVDMISWRNDIYHDRDTNFPIARLPPSITWSCIAYNHVCKLHENSRWTHSRVLIYHRNSKWKVRLHLSKDDVMVFYQVLKSSSKGLVSVSRYWLVKSKTYINHLKSNWSTTCIFSYPKIARNRSIMSRQNWLLACAIHHSIRRFIHEPGKSLLHRLWNGLGNGVLLCLVQYYIS